MLTQNSKNRKHRLKWKKIETMNRRNKITAVKMAEKTVKNKTMNT